MLTREEIKLFENLVDKIFETRTKGQAVVTCYLCSGNFQLRTVYQVDERYVCEECAGKVEVAMQDDIRGDFKDDRWEYKPEGRIEGALR